MSGLQGLIGYEGCCCGDAPCPSTLCGFVDTANNGSIRNLELPPLFDIATSFTLSVASSATFGCVKLTPYSDTYYEWQICAVDDDCCDYSDCESGGGCSREFCNQVEEGDYHLWPSNFNTFFEPAHICTGVQPWVNITENAIVGSNLAQHLWSGNFTYPSGCLDSGPLGNGCNSDDYCATPKWLTNYFPMTCEAILNIDGSAFVPANTNYATIDAKFRVLNIDYSSGGIDWYDYRPTCDCKCPFIELAITVSGVIFYSITDVIHQPPDPVSYSTLLPSSTVLTYRKRLVRSKALNYYTYYDWINDTTEPFHLFMIQSGEDGVHTFCAQNAVNGSLATCTDVPAPDCVSQGGTDGSGPTYYVESYGSLCSSASSETSNAVGISTASCRVYPDEIQLSIAANYAPIITGISPSTGTTAGGTLVTVTGTGLWGCHEVRLDGTLAPNFVVNTSNTTQFSFTTPAHAAGSVQVLCKWSWGTATTNFTYV